MRLGSGIAVAVVCGCRSNLTPSLKFPYATGVAVKKKKKKNPAGVVLGALGGLGPFTLISYLIRLRDDTVKTKTYSQC